MNTLAQRTLSSASLAVLFLALQVCASPAIKVGVGKVDITPTEPMRLYGYASRTAPFVGIYDPLFCRSVVFDDGATKAVIISLDSGTIPLGNWPQTIRKLLPVNMLGQRAVHTNARVKAGHDDFECGRRRCVALLQVLRNQSDVPPNLFCLLR